MIPLSRVPVRNRKLDKDKKKKKSLGVGLSPRVEYGIELTSGTGRKRENTKQTNKVVDFTSL